MFMLCVLVFVLVLLGEGCRGLFGGVGGDGWALVGV